MNQFLKYVINSFINTDQSKCHHKFHKISNIFKKIRSRSHQIHKFFQKRKIFRWFFGEKTIYKQ